MLPVLILGQGFVGTYLADILRADGIEYAATTTDGRNSTIKWSLPEPTRYTDIGFADLPAADTVVVTFPLQGIADAKCLVEGYYAAHRQTCGSALDTFWIYLGSTRPFKETPSTRFTKPDLATSGPRVEAEEYIINKWDGCVLNLAGLWGGERVPEKWARFYNSQDKLRSRLRDRSLHLIHGADAARAIHGIVRLSDRSARPVGRWLLSDGTVYDALQVFIGDACFRGFLEDLLCENEDVRALLGADTVDNVKMGKSSVALRIDSSHFWTCVNLEPKFPYVVGQPDPYLNQYSSTDVQSYNPIY